MAIRNTCGVGVIILNKDNEVLMQRRGDDNTWSIPGGGMEIGESTLETAVREVKEETGLNVSELKLFNVFSGASQYHKYPDGNEYYFTNIVYTTRVYTGTLEIDNLETLELQFFNIENMPGKLAGTNEVIMSDLRSRLLEIE